MSASSQFTVLIGSYAPEGRRGIHVLALDVEAGTLRPRSAFAGIANPSYLAAHPGGRVVYAVSEIGGRRDGMQGAVVALDLASTGELTVVNRLSTMGDHPCHVGVDPVGRWLAATNYASGEVVIMSLATDGSLGEMADRVMHRGSGPNLARQSSPHPHSAVFSPDGRFLVVADLGTDEIAVYAVDDEGGLERHQVLSRMPGSGPRHTVFAPTGDHLFVVEELGNTLAALRWNSTSGSLDLADVVSTLPPGNHGDGLAAAVRVSRDGGNVHVSSRGPDNVATFGFDPRLGFGQASFRATGGSWPRDVDETPGGGMLIVANEHSDLVALVELDPTDAGVEVADAVHVANPSCVLVIEDPTRRSG